MSLSLFTNLGQGYGAGRHEKKLCLKNSAFMVTQENHGEI
jgi:hypothetical protein